MRQIGQRLTPCQGLKSFEYRFRLSFLRRRKATVNVDYVTRSRAYEDGDNRTLRMLPKQGEPICIVGGTSEKSSASS